MFKSSIFMFNMIQLCLNGHNQEQWLHSDVRKWLASVKYRRKTEFSDFSIKVCALGWAVLCVTVNFSVICASNVLLALMVLLFCRKLLSSPHVTWANDTIRYEFKRGCEGKNAFHWSVGNRGMLEGVLFIFTCTTFLSFFHWTFCRFVPGSYFFTVLGQ